MAKVVLAYSGGLDTSVILAWLLEQGHEVHAVYSDLGQPGEDQQAIKKKALRCGAASAHILEGKEELCRDFAFPMLQFGAKYEQVYLMGTAIARPVITRACLKVADQVQAEAFAHGATGKGNDQCRFELVANALRPKLQVIAPWRDESFRRRFPGRDQMIAYAEEHRIPVKATKDAPYSTDENCLHVSYEAGVLEDPAQESWSKIKFVMTVDPASAPDQPETVRVRFKDGLPESVNGRKMSAYRIVAALNRIGGRHGVGRFDLVENRFVGMKSRGVYEAPGMALLYQAHRLLEGLCLDRDLLHLKDRLAVEVAELCYYGYWYSRKMDALLAFLKESQRHVTGEVQLRLYKGNLEVLSRTSPYSLYDASVASMHEEGAFDQGDSEGFVRIQGLPSRVQARVFPREL